MEHDGAKKPDSRKRLDSWKEIGAYLNVSVRTVQRWEAKDGLPVHRLQHESLGTVYAFAEEVEEWFQRRSNAEQPKGHPGNAGPAWQQQLEAVRESLQHSKPRTAALREPAFPVVGRQSELAELAAGLESVRRGGSLMISLTGEAGIGKTTLMQAFRDNAAREGDVVVAAGRCSERLAGSDAYLSILDVLASLTRETNGAVEALLRLVAPTWYVQIAPLQVASGELREVADDARGGSRNRMKLEMLAFLREQASVRPLVILLDDLHWADHSTVELLSYLLGQPSLDHVLVVGSYRATEMTLSNDRFRQVMQGLRTRRVWIEIQVSTLTQQQTAEYIDTQYEAHSFPKELARITFERAEGNPLFMADFLRDLECRGTLRSSGGRWVFVGSLEEVRASLPDSIRELVTQKLSQIGERGRGLLALMAIAGDELESTVLATAAEISRAAVENALTELQRVHRVLAFVGEGELPDGSVSRRYRFAHALYQSVLYDSLSPSRVAELSGRLADALLTHFASHAASVAAELALLLEKSRRFREASDFFLLAARKAVTVYANDEAIALSRRAVQNAARLPPDERLPREQAAAFQLAQLHLTLSDFEGAAADFFAAEEASIALGDTEQQIDAICGAALAVFNRKRVDETRVMAERALELARRAKSEYGVASAEIVLAMERMSLGDTSAAVELVKRAQPVLIRVDRVPTPIHVIEGVSYCAAHYGWQADIPHAVPPLEWALERAHDRGVCFHIVCCLFIQGLGYGTAGDLSGALSSLEEAVRLAELNNERFWLPRLPNTRGWLFREMQDFDQAIRLNTEGVDMAAEMGFSEGTANSHIQLAGVYSTLGDVERASAHLIQAKPLLDKDQWFRWSYTCRYEAEVARCRLLERNVKVAKSHALALLKLAKSTRKTKHIALGHKLLGDIERVEGREERAGPEYRRALRVLSQRPIPTAEWPVLQAYAAHLREVGEANKARDALKRASSIAAGLAETIRDPRLRSGFLSSEAVRRLDE